MFRRRKIRNTLTQEDVVQISLGTLKLFEVEVTRGYDLKQNEKFITILIAKIAAIDHGDAVQQLQKHFPEELHENQVEPYTFPDPRFRYLIWYWGERPNKNSATDAVILACNSKYYYDDF